MSPRRKIWRPPAGASKAVWWAWYTEYLQSREWQKIRGERLDFDGRRCTLCSFETGLQVHHLTYDFVGQERIEDLRTLCEECHQDQHERATAMKKQEAYDEAYAEAERNWAIMAARKEREHPTPFNQDLTTRRRPVGVPATANKWLPQCEAITKKGHGHQCPVVGSGQHEGKWYCHVHHPLMLYRQQQREKKERKLALALRP